MSERLFTASVLAILFSALSLLCSFINVVLIHVMQQWNGFLAVLYSMAFCQILYDATFYLTSDTTISPTAVAVWSFCQAVGGLSVTFWTNVLSAVVLYVVSQRTRFNILRFFWTLSFIVYFPSFAIAIIEITCTLRDMEQCKFVMTEIYYWARLVSIAFNFVVFGYLYRYTRGIPINWANNRSPAEVSMTVLSRRMMYYPLIQFFCRIFKAVYEPLYGFGPYDGDPSSSLASRQQFILQCLACITQPSAGIGFLVVFLVFQPHAKEHMWALLTRCSTVDVTKSQSALSTFEPPRSAFQLDHISSWARTETEAAPQSSYQTRFGTEASDPRDKFIFLDENDLMAIIYRESTTSRSSQRTVENPLL
jgi:hypothetical protein